MKTINLKGKEYAPVSERLKALHEEVAQLEGEDKHLRIETEVTLGENSVLVKATVTTYRGTFTGHSLGSFKNDKGVEKQESVAVGRALAFAGFTADGEIASYDEVKEFFEEKDNFGV